MTTVTVKDFLDEFRDSIERTGRAQRRLRRALGRRDD